MNAIENNVDLQRRLLGIIYKKSKGALGVLIDIDDIYSSIEDSNKKIIYTTLVYLAGENYICGEHSDNTGYSNFQLMPLGKKEHESYSLEKDKSSTQPLGKEYKGDFKNFTNYLWPLFWVATIVISFSGNLEYRLIIIIAVLLVPGALFISWKKKWLKMSAIWAITLITMLGIILLVLIRIIIA